MRLAIVSTMAAVAWGGSEELWAATALRAAARGDDVLAMMRWWPRPRPQVERLERAGVRFSRFAPAEIERQRKRRFLVKHPTVAARLGHHVSVFRRLFAFKPDVVCLSLGDTFALAAHYEFRLLLDLLRRRGIPYVVVCQLSTSYWTPTEAAAKLTAEHFAGARRVGFVSEANRRLVERQIGTSLDNALVLRNPVNMSDTSAVAWPADGSLRLAGVARLDLGHKGQDILAAALADEAWSRRDCRLRLYGEGPDEARLRALLNEQCRIETAFQGQVDDIRSVWADNHVLVMPSRMEGTPLAMVEAMLCGRPVVATDIGGVTEWVRDGESGFIAAEASAEAFGEALDRMWARRDGLEAMGQAARRRALELYDPDPGGRCCGCWSRRRRAPSRGRRDAFK
jgi:glycosyltransferase involved in cell wall biosynthesis